MREEKRCVSITTPAVFPGRRLELQSNASDLELTNPVLTEVLLMHFIVWVTMSSHETIRLISIWNKPLFSLYLRELKVPCCL